MPFEMINEWLTNEEVIGSPNSRRFVLATSGKNNVPHSRVIAIREIINDSIVFFTQKGTRKTDEMNHNPVASGTIWLPLQQRQIILDGRIEILSTDEKTLYWKTLPRHSQLKFMAYAPTSAQPIQTIGELQKKFHDLEIQFRQKEIPISEYYLGYRLIPQHILFYTLSSDDFSELIRYDLEKNTWNKMVLSP